MFGSETFLSSYIYSMSRFIPEILHRTFNSPTRRATLQSILTGVAGQAVLVLSGIIVARALGPEGRGYLALLVIFPMLLCQIGSLGLPHAVTYFIARNYSASREIYLKVKKPFLIQIAVLVITHLIIISLYIQEQPKEVMVAAFLTIAVIPGVLGQQYGLAVLQGGKRYSIFNFLRLMPATLHAFGVLIIFIAGVASLPVIALIWVISNLVIGLVTFTLSIKQLPGPKSGKKDREVAHFSPMLKFGIKGLVGTFSPLQSFRLDQLVAGLFLSPASLGIYVVGQAFSNLLRFIAQSAGMVLYPSLAASGDSKKARRLMLGFFAIVAILNGIILLMLMVLMPILVPFFFGKAFSGSIPIARLLLLGAFFESLRRILVEGLRGLGRPQVSTFAEITMYPWLLTGGVFLMWRYGIMGVAIGVVVGYALSLVAAVIIGIDVTRKDKKPPVSVIYTQKTEIKSSVHADTVKQ